MTSDEIPAVLRAMARPGHRLTEEETLALREVAGRHEVIADSAKRYIRLKAALFLCGIDADAMTEEST